MKARQNHNVKLVRVTNDLHAMVTELAQFDRRTIPAEIAWLIEQEIARRSDQDQPGLLAHGRCQEA